MVFFELAEDAIPFPRFLALIVRQGIFRYAYLFSSVGEARPEAAIGSAWAISWVNLYPSPFLD